jgi:hypothetical protein
MIDTGLTHYWSFDDGFQAVVGGSSYDFQAFNGASINPAGMFGGAAQFSRASSQYLYATGPIYTGGDMTYMAWYRLDTAIGGSDRYFIMETDGGQAAVSYGLRLNASLPQGQVFAQTTGGSANFYTNNGTLLGGEPNVWHNLIVTLDGATGTYTAYLNGLPAGTLAAGLVGTVYAFDTGLAVGAHRSLTGRNFEGLIDEVAFWNRMLSLDEIVVLQTSTVPEPAAYATLLGALALLFLVYRRYRS